MNDYRERFEQQLVEASRRLSESVDTPPRRAARNSRRALYCSAVSLLCATTAAVAATRPWAPLLGDPKFPETQATATSSAPPQSQLAVLGVLRREPRGADQGREVTAALKYLGSHTLGVRTKFVRRAATFGTGDTAIVVPAQTWQPAAGERSRPITDAVCLVLTQPTVNTAAKGCWSSATIRAGEATASLVADVYGIVPDGVTHVVATFEGSSGLLGSSPEVSVEVVDNVFVLRAPTGGDPEAPTPTRPVRLEGRDVNDQIILELRP